MIVNKSELKRITKFRISRQFENALEDELKFLVSKAEDRARSNGRYSLMARDV